MFDCRVILIIYFLLTFLHYVCADFTEDFTDYLLRMFVSARYLCLDPYQFLLCFFSIHAHLFKINNSIDWLIDLGILEVGCETDGSASLIILWVNLFYIISIRSFKCMSLNSLNVCLFDNGIWLLPYLYLLEICHSCISRHCLCTVAWSACRLIYISIANIMVLSILHGATSHCCFAFFYNAWLPGSVHYFCLRYYKNIHSVSVACYRVT